MTKISDIGDLTPLCVDIKKVIKKHFTAKDPVVAVCFMLNPKDGNVHWVTNVSRLDGINLFKEASIKMFGGIN